MDEDGNLTIGNDGKANGCLSFYGYKVFGENGVLLKDVIKDDCREYYTISFNTNGGNDVESIVVREKKKINYPKNVTKFLDGILYTFDKWITVDGENAPMIMPSDDVTFYAEYQDLGSLFKNGFITSTLNGNDKTLVKAIKQIENIDDVPIEYKTSTYNMSRNSIPIYMWYDTVNEANTIYWYSYDKTPGFVSNTSFSNLFKG